MLVSKNVTEDILHQSSVTFEEYLISAIRDQAHYFLQNELHREDFKKFRQIFLNTHILIGKVACCASILKGKFEDAIFFVVSSMIKFIGKICGFVTQKLWHIKDEKIVDFS